jgi:hypothetical protein
MTNALIDELIDVLNKESVLYEDILKMSGSKTDIIVQGKVSDLESITRIEQALILQIGKLENEREKIADRLAKQLKVEPSEITVTKLSKYLPKGDASRLKACCIKFGSTIKSLSDTNGLNSKLIRNSLDYIDFSLNIFSNAGSANNLYSNLGQTNDSKKRNFFDMKL